MLLTLSYATIAGIWLLSQFVFVPYVLHLVVLVTAILYAACHASLCLLETPPNGAPKPERDTLQASDAYQFPLVGSLSLFSLYLAFKFLDPTLVNRLIGAYFGIVGTLAITLTLTPWIQGVPHKQLGWREWIVEHPFPAWLVGPSPWDFSLQFTLQQAIAFGVSAAIVVGYFWGGKAWYWNNVLGIAFCLQGIERFSLGTFRIGAILLIGLFFYDIFWVFGTEVMVTVAKSLDGPIKLLFPREGLEKVDGKLQLSLLGLGDIVIPGFFLALLLRFDAKQAKIATSTPIDIHARFPKPYFHASLLGYVLGLGTTLWVMIQFDAAQPALLYLVPACLGSSLGCALLRGETQALFAYSEEEEEDDEAVAVKKAE